MRMPIRLKLVGVCAAIVASMVLATPARASFGVESFEAALSEQNGSPATQAGSHPYAFTTAVVVNHLPPTEAQAGAGLNGYGIPDGDVRNLEVTLPAGLVVNLLGVARCSEVELAREACPASSQVGVIKI